MSHEPKFYETPNAAEERKRRVHSNAGASKDNPVSCMDSKGNKYLDEGKGYRKQGNPFGRKLSKKEKKALGKARRRLGFHLGQKIDRARFDETMAKVLDPKPLEEWYEGQLTGQDPADPELDGLAE